MPRFTPTENPDQGAVNIDTLTWESAEHTYDRSIFSFGVYAPLVAACSINGEQEWVQIHYEVDTQSATMFFHSTIGATKDNPSGAVATTDEAPEFDSIFGKQGWRQFLSDYEHDCQDDWEHLDPETRESYAEHGYC